MLRFGRVGVGFGVDHQSVGVGPVRDPELGSVQHVVVLYHIKILSKYDIIIYSG